MASLKLNGLDKVYPSGTVALYDINLETAVSEFLVILGADASGKTTLLRTIAGLEEASDGEIIIDGKNLTEAEPKDRDVAMVFRSSSLTPTATVYDNMAFGLKVRKTPQTVIDQRVKAAANVLGLNDVLYRKPKVLTAAQKQRTAIGRAIAREPNLYLFDEPLSGLDEALQAELLNVIVNLQARMEGTFVYTTKNPAEALTLGTRIAVLKNGFLQQVDTPSNLYDYPENAYVAFYIGSPTINFINNAKLIKEEDGVYACEGQLKLKLPESILARFENIEEYISGGKQVIIGIRPEDCFLSGGDIDVTVTKVEDGFAEVSLDGHVLCVKAEGTANKGDKNTVSFNLDRLYLFDGATRLTLLKRDAGYNETGFADANFKPLAFDEEERLKEKFKPKKTEKKKR